MRGRVRASFVALALGIVVPAILLRLAGVPGPSQVVESTGAPSPSRLIQPTLATLRSLSWTPGGYLLATAGTDVLLSSDSGASWQLMHLPENRRALSGTVAESGAVIAVSTDRGDEDPEALADVFIDRSADQGASWAENPILVRRAAVNASIGATAEGRVGVLLAPTRQGEPASTMSVSSDGGATWTRPVTIDSPPLLGPLGVSSTSLAAVAGVPGEIPYQPDGLAVSHDAGETWETFGFPSVVGFTEDAIVAFGRPASSGGEAFRTVVAYARDGRGVVEVLDCHDAACDPLGSVSGVVEDGGVLSLVGDNVFVGMGAVIWRSEDGGLNWRSIKVDLGGPIVALSFRSADVGWVDVAVQGGGFTVYVTSDAGVRWRPVLNHG